jgi:hypothetical protein
MTAMVYWVEIGKTRFPKLGVSDWWNSLVTFAVYSQTPEDRNTLYMISFFG